MAEQTWPKVEVVATATNYARFKISPLDLGYGGTLGNSLRRILLSSLPGSAVTNIRIDNIYHEFSSIPKVKEDVTEIVLNVKKIRLRSFSERPVTMRLSYSGHGAVKAEHIQLPSSVELINPEQELAHLDGEDARFEMELTVERGRGYLSSEGRENPTIGLIPVDAIFNPVPKVNYLVQKGEDGSEDLLLEIWTDGTIEPADALSTAAQIMVQHTSLIGNFHKGVSSSSSREDRHPSITAPIPSHIAEMPIEQLNLSVRTYNCLKRSNVTKVGAILQMDRKDLMAVRNFGDKSYNELIGRLMERGLLPPDSELARDYEASGHIIPADEDSEALTDDDSDAREIEVEEDEA